MISIFNLSIIFFFYFGAIISSETHTQQKPIYHLLESSLNSDCIFSTKGINKAYGLNINLHYPCTWKAKEDIQLIPIRVKSFSNEVFKNYRLGVSLDVERYYTDSLTERDINRFRTKEFQEFVLAGSDQTFIKLTPTRINGIEGDQVISVLKSKTEYSKFLLTHLYYKRFIITIAFVVNASKKEELESLFKKYEPMFTSLSNATTIDDLK